MEECQMVSSHDDALKFIREFELSSREYLLAKGTSEHELDSAYLELQWKFLRTIIQKQPSPRRSANTLRRKSHSIA
jgi:hypothetical protein